MLSKTYTFKDVEEVEAQLAHIKQFNASLVIVYAAPSLLNNSRLFTAIKAICKHCVGCSTAGEIRGQQVSDDSICVVAIRFETDAYVDVFSEQLTSMNASFKTGEALSQQLAKNHLKGVYVLAPGLDINGTALINGLTTHLPEHVGISGGLAADAGVFENTFVLGPDGIDSRQVVAVGFYGDNLQFGYGACGGWRSFGPARRITQAQENILYQLDGQPALDIYKLYLGDYANQLPSTGLLFPFEKLTDEGEPTGLIRTILAVDEDRKAVVLAGEVEEGHYLRLMHASSDDLIDGATETAKLAASQLPEYQQTRPELTATDENALALITSCVGRKLVMGDRVEEEIEEASRIIPLNTAIAGFYSYGEISSNAESFNTELYNQTMTMLLIKERL
jgi:hypothetical protein